MYSDKHMRCPLCTGTRSKHEKDCAFPKLRRVDLSWLHSLVVATFGGVGILLLLLGLCVGPGSCVSDSQAIAAAETNGFTDPQIINRTNFTMFSGCGREDVAAFRVHATNPAGRRVTILVCAGLFKGSTIRTP